MKLQKQTTDYKRGYHKYVFVVPKKIIEKSQLKEGDEVYAEVKKGEINWKKKKWKKLIGIFHILIIWDYFVICLYIKTSS